MKTKWKNQIVSGLLSAIMLASSFAIPVYADETETAVETDLNVSIETEMETGVETESETCFETESVDESVLETAEIIETQCEDCAAYSIEKDYVSLELNKSLNFNIVANEEISFMFSPDEDGYYGILHEFESGVQYSFELYEYGEYEKYIPLGSWNLSKGKDYVYTIGAIDSQIKGSVKLVKYRDVESVKLISAPNYTTYVVDNLFPEGVDSMEGLEIEVIYADATSERFKINENNADTIMRGKLELGLDWSEVQYSVPGIYKIYVSVNGCRVSYDIHVVESDTNLSISNIKKYSMKDTYSFRNSSHKVPRSYYTRIFGEVNGNDLWKTYEKNADGVCFGMVTSAMASTEYKYPKALSYSYLGGLLKAETLYDVRSSAWNSSQINMSAIEYIMYAHIWQIMPTTLNQRENTENDIKKLEDAIIDNILNDGEPVCLDVFNDYAGHSLWVIGIGENSDELFEVIVYDCNYPGQQKTVSFYKENGKLTGWKYEDYTIFKFCTVADDFVEWFQSGKSDETGQSASLWKYLTSSDDKIRISNENNFTSTLENAVDLEYIVPITKTGAEGSTDDSICSYWIDIGDNIKLEAADQNVEVSLADANNGIKLSIPANSEADITLSDVGNDSVKLILQKNEPFSLAYSASSENNAINVIDISGMVDTSILEINQTDEGILLSSGTFDNLIIEKEVVDADGNQKLQDSVKISSNQDTVLIKDEEEVLTGWIDENNDGVYEKEVSEHMHTWNDEYTVDKKASCKVEGSKSIHCSTCDDVKEGSSVKISKTEHSMGSWKTIKQATVLEEGKKERVCDVCGKKETGSIPKITYDSDVKNFVAQLYNVCLNRNPDDVGLKDWSNKLTSKQIDGITAAYGFVFSQEFINKNLCNEDYVKQLYSAFLGRKPDAVGLADWVSQMENGTTREDIFNGFALSQEFKGLCEQYGINQGVAIDVSGNGTIPAGKCAICGKTEVVVIDGVSGFVKRLYKVCLNRQADAAGLEDWTGKLKAHKATGRSVAYGFIFSQEFINKNYNNSDYVEHLYLAFMGRGSDPAGKADWIKRMEKDKWTREQVFDGFVGSQEFTGICNSYGITRD